MEARILADRTVCRLDPGPFQRAPTHFAHMAPLRDRLSIFLSAVVSQRSQQAVPGQMPGALEASKRSHLGQDRVGQDPRDAGQRPQPPRGWIVALLPAEFARYAGDLTPTMIQQLQVPLHHRSGTYAEPLIL